MTMMNTLASPVRPLICETIAAGTTVELVAKRDGLLHADLIELRLDAVKDLDVAGALRGRRVPVVATCRPQWEGGAFAGSEEERRRVLEQAIALDAEYVDVEFGAGLDDLIERRQGKGVVLSMHDFRGVPRDLDDRVRAMRGTGADVIKIAIQARRVCDTLPLLRLRRDGRAATIAMGPAGLPSRVLAARFRSCWTYTGERTDLGQMPSSRLIDEFRFREVAADSQVFGIVGSPLSHSVSPAMHNAGFRAAGIDAVYVPIEASDADDFLDFARGVGVKGVSITAPFKRDLFDAADEVDAVSRRVGAINTLRLEGRRWIGTNTDVNGFLAPLAGRVELRNARAAIVGTGGAARAVAVALASVGCQVTIYGRDRQRARDAAVVVGADAALLPPSRGSWDLLVNATPVGTYPRVDESPVPSEALDGRVVYDLVYNPSRTRLLREAEAAGCATVGGLDMLVEQALLQFQWWTGHRPSATLFRKAAIKRLEQLSHPLEEQPV